jgi:hypothetical protein
MPCYDPRVEIPSVYPSASEAEARCLKDENAKLTAMLCGMIRGIERVRFDPFVIYDAEGAGIPASELKIWWWRHKRKEPE